MREATRIGELNGRWAALLKATLVAVPVITSLFIASFIPWAVWVTGNIYTSQRSTEILQQITSDLNALDARIDVLPSQEWKERVLGLENEAKLNREDHSQIKIGLEQIKAAVGVHTNDQQ